MFLNNDIEKIIKDNSHMSLVGFGEKSLGIKYVILGHSLPIDLREKEGFIKVSSEYFTYFENFRKAMAEAFDFLNVDGYTCKVISPISLKEDLRGLARRAGIGERGLNRSILHKDFGGNLLLCGFYTDAPIKPFEGVVPDNCIKCGQCIKICPGKAITKKGVMIYRCSPYSLRACQKCLDVCPIGDLKYKLVYRRGVKKNE